MNLRRSALLQFLLFLASFAISPLTSGCQNGDTDEAFGHAGAPDFPKHRPPCEFTVSAATVSAKVPTIGIFEGVLDLEDADAIWIEFGQSKDYGLTASIDLDEPTRPTLLLGMAESTLYHYRVVVRTGKAECETSDRTILTGPAPNDLRRPVVSSGSSKKKRASGFIVNGTYQGGWLYIIDERGEIVWFHESPFNDPTRVRFSWDGRFIWTRDGNPHAQFSAGKIARIALDGTSIDVADVPGSHHDLTVLPDGSIAYLKLLGEESCDGVFLHEPGSFDFSSDRLLFDLGQAFQLSSGQLGKKCHANSLHYHHFDHSITVGDLKNDAYVKISLNGNLLWILGGANSYFEGQGAIWSRQHGHHLVAPDRLLFFNNRAVGMDSRITEVTLDLETMSATFGRFFYETKGVSSQFLGDVQRLPNGNTLVTYSSQGLTHEVDSTGELIQSIQLPGSTAGYTEFRSSLYGPPLVP